MKTLIIAGIFGAGIFLTGCVPIFVERRHDHGHYDYGLNGYEQDHYREGYNGTHDPARR